TGGWRVTPSPVGSTPTRFRQASHSACFFEIYCGTLTGRVVAWGGGLVAPTPAEPAFAPTTFPITSPETIISTRRFSLRPAAVSLSATGSAFPKPWAATLFMETPELTR